MDELVEAYAPSGPGDGSGAGSRQRATLALGVLLREVLGLTSTAALAASFAAALAAYFAPSLTEAFLRFGLAALFFAVGAILVRATMLIRDALAARD